LHIAHQAQCRRLRRGLQRVNSMGVRQGRSFEWPGQAQRAGTPGVSDSGGGVVAMISFGWARYVAVLLAGLIVGSVVTGWLWDARLSKADAEHATQITAIVRAASVAATEALQRQHHAQTQLSEI